MNKKCTCTLTDKITIGSSNYKFMHAVYVWGQAKLGKGLLRQWLISDDLFLNRQVGVLIIQISKGPVPCHPSERALDKS